jgi:hypothetical protein
MFLALEVGMSDGNAPQGPERRLAQLLVLFFELVLLRKWIDDSGIDEILRKYSITLTELDLLEKYIGLFRTANEPGDEVIGNIHEEEILYCRDVCPNCAAAELDILIKSDDVLLSCPYCHKEFKRD